MTEALVHRRFPALSQVDAGTIAEFSGGNARIAIALAGTVQRGESLSGFADEELFRRLFLQNHQPDPDLLRAAEVCALVYSFDGENTDADGELARLGRLARQDPADLYARVAELRRRDLVQARRQWRALRRMPSPTGWRSEPCKLHRSKFIESALTTARLIELRDRFRAASAICTITPMSPGSLRVGSGRVAFGRRRRV